jgi:formylglycine-generating enzyme required for sulfatase activity
MGHIFISYNHKDTEYAHKFADALRSKGFAVWIDDAIEYGSEWPSEIQEHLDECDLLVVIMTPASYRSKWVQNELNRAMRKNKPIFPLLLEGDEPWLSVEAIQYTDVRGGKLPPEKFYKLLANATSQEKPISKRKAENNSLKLPLKALLAFIVLAGFVTTFFLGRYFLTQPSEPTSESTSVPSPVVLQTLTPSTIFTETALPTTTLEIVNDLTSLQDGMSSVYIPGGSFIMGSNSGYSDERPSHQVTLDDYWIDKTEITNFMYGLCVQDGKCPPPSNMKYYSENKYADYPVGYVNWFNAEAYCSWAGRRLPTEAEWEKAARGTDGRTYPWGNDFGCQFGNFDDENQYDSDMVKGGPNCDGFIDASPVGSFPNGVSPYGIFDMSGNVWEWVADWYGESYYRRSPNDNPTGPSSGDERVIRGGSWNYLEVVMRTSNRLKQLPTESYSYIGFRCATSNKP